MIKVSHHTVEFHATKWFMGEAVLELEAHVVAHINGILVTLERSYQPKDHPPLKYWQQLAFFDWVTNHESLLRKLHESQQEFLIRSQVSGAVRALGNAPPDFPAEIMPPRATK